MNWLLLRGLSREKRHWGTFPEQLETASGDRVFCLDLPGFGSEVSRPSPITIRGITEDLRSRWRLLKEQAGGEWGLLGMSLGGMVTMQWGSDHPDDFSRVVIVNSSAANLSRPWQRMRPAILSNAARTLTEKDPVKKERTVLGITTRLAPNLDEIAAQWAGYTADAKPAPTAVLRQLLAAMRFTAPATLAPSVLVVVGAQDPLCEPACSRRIAEHFKADIEVHPGGGHELAVDAGEWLAERVASWSRSLAMRAVG